MAVSPNVEWSRKIGLLCGTIFTDFFFLLALQPPLGVVFYIPVVAGAN